MIGDSFDSFAPLSIPDPRSIRRQWVKEAKQEHSIFTHNSPDGDWMALSMPECIRILEGYELTEVEKSNPIELLMGYCRLLDEAGAIEEGHKTEYLTVQALVERLEKKR